MTTHGTSRVVCTAAALVCRSLRASRSCFELGTPTQFLCYLLIFGHKFDNPFSNALFEFVTHALDFSLGLFTPSGAPSLDVSLSREPSKPIPLSPEW